MDELTIAEISQLAEHALKSLPDKPGLGLLLFIETEQADQLYELGIALAKLSDPAPLPIYVTQGQLKKDWSFSRIKRGARLRLEADGSMVIETGGLIFPQDKPIVLLVECFDHFELHDQRNYCHLVDGEGDAENLALHRGSILIAGLISTNRGKLVPGSASRGLHFSCESA